MSQTKIDVRDNEFTEFKEIIENLEVEEIETGLSNNKEEPLKTQNLLENDDENNEIRKKWKEAAKRSRFRSIKAKKSWTLIDGSVEPIGYSSSDDCWRWVKRLLTIGNIGVITMCLCLLIGSSYFCFRR